MRVVLSMMRKRSWNLSEVLTEDKDGSIHERRGGAMMRRAGEAMRRFEVASGRGRWRSPCRRAVDRAPMRADGDYLRKLALCRKVAGDVLVVGGYGTEFFAGAFVRVEYDNGFSCAFLEIVKRRNEIGVAGDEYDAVKILFHVVDEHLGSDVYVRAFFFGFPHCCDGNLPAGLAGFLCKRIAGTESFIVALDDLQFIVFFISIFQKGKGRTFVRPCTASPRLSGR